MKAHESQQFTSRLTVNAERQQLMIGPKFTAARFFLKGDNDDWVILPALPQFVDNIILLPKAKGSSVFKNDLITLYTF